MFGGICHVLCGGSSTCFESVLMSCASYIQEVPDLTELPETAGPPPYRRRLCPRPAAAVDGENVDDVAPTEEDGGVF